MTPPCAANLGGGISANNGGDRSTVPFCISILTSVRRIVKIAVRFLHTKTALCDRKDTQSHFVVNAARSIVCVGTHRREREGVRRSVSMPHAALCVSGPSDDSGSPWQALFQCRTQHCVCRDRKGIAYREAYRGFQCRTQHCVCRDRRLIHVTSAGYGVSMPHAALCVSGQEASDVLTDGGSRFNAARSIVCVGTPLNLRRLYVGAVSMPHAALCVSGLCVPQPLSHTG